MTAESLLAVFGLAVAVLGLGAAVVVGLRGKALETDLERVRKANSDLRAELEDVSRRLHDTEVEYEQLKASDTRKDAALRRIGEQAASGAELQQLADALRQMSGTARDHDREAAARHAATIRALREVREEQERVRAAIGARP